MQNFQHFDSKPDSTAAKLLEVDADLAAREANLMAELQSIQEKRRSLKTVIDMFAPSDTAKPLEAPIQATDANSTSAKKQITPELNEPQPAPTLTADANGSQEFSVQEQETPELDNSQAAPDDVSTPAVDQLNRKKKTPTKANKTRTAKTAQETKTSNKTQGWQDYLRQEFSDATLSDAVSAVLQQHEEQALEITAVVDAIFEHQMPQQVRTKARDRVSNILSEGARKNKWYRTHEGSYSMSSVATQDD